MYRLDQPVLRRLARTALAVNSPLALNDILGIILAEAMAHMGAARGAVITRDRAGRFSVRASVGLGPQDIGLPVAGHSEGSGSISGWPQAVSALSSPIMVPIISGGCVVGLMVLVGDMPAKASGPERDIEEQEEILSIFAEYATMALELDRLRAGSQVTPVGAGFQATPAGTGFQPTPAGAGPQAAQGANGACDKRGAIDLSQVSVVAHELRTPLTSTRAYTQLLLQGRLGDVSPRQKEALEVIERNILRMARIINDMLDMARIREGRLTLTKQIVHLGEVVASAIQEVTPLADAKKIRIEVAIPDGIWGAWDKDRIQQVFLNLLDNAIKFTPPEGRIVVRARAEGCYVQAEVSDNGKGISRRKLDRIFEPFPNTDVREREPGAGMGLGLSICRGIVEAHGGRIWVESQEGAGTTFFFTLPLGNEGNQCEKKAM